jgi:hypothetical protein
MTIIVEYIRHRRNLMLQEPMNCLNGALKITLMVQLTLPVFTIPLRVRKKNLHFGYTVTV